MKNLSQSRDDDDDEKYVCTAVILFPIRKTFREINRVRLR